MKEKIDLSQAFKNKYKIENNQRTDNNNNKNRQTQSFPHQMREISLIDFTSIPMNINNNDTSEKRECVISSNTRIDILSFLYYFFLY